MNNKASALGLAIVFFFFLELTLAFAACTTENTPRIISADYFELYEGLTFVNDFNVSNMLEESINYAYASVDPGLSGISIDKQGVLKFTPADSETGLHRVAVLAVKDDCSDTRIITFRIFDRPDITSFDPADSFVQISQAETLLFRISAVDRDENESLSYLWFVGSKLINDSINKTTIFFNPGFDISGTQELSVNVTDSKGLMRKKSWSLQVSKVNRPPVLMFNIPNFMIFWNTASGAYNLADYFKDPEGGLLNYSHRQVIPQFEVKGLAYANVTVKIDGTSFVTYDPIINTSGYTYFVFTATDMLGLSTDSNIVKVEVVGSDDFQDLESASQKDYCGDKICSVLEDCKSCPYDCGECEGEQETGCKPDWNCTEWGPCQPAGFQVRNCTDNNECEDNRSKPDEIKRCIYNATCDDGLKNGIEEGVDCGGPCGPCPTCLDGIQNQGEEGVDCGGPCSDACPSCNDTILNQNESDVDCGGSCPGCAGGKLCLGSHDCESLKCISGLCTYPSCDDEVKNQGEEGIDCGGPCTKLCGNCSDGMQNRGEEGVDCGGRCPPCPRCDDGILNDNETMVDCGGVCRECGFADYFNKYRLLFIAIFVILGFIPLLLVTYFFFLLASLDRARKLYENNTAFAFIVGTNRFLRKFRRMRGKGPALNESAINTFIGELMSMAKRPDLTSKQLYDEIAKIYSAVLGLSEDSDQHSFQAKIRGSSLPLLLKVLYAGYYKKADILAMATYVAPEQRIDMIMELQFLLSEAAKG
ncbi:hypothetical protein JXB28_00245 [Candidatus Woesearchaeota archaeon]|nr:hypothetical protein [Candidatus Woesearchaeota archaeon]